jgi:hypothetical protein
MILKKDTDQLNLTFSFKINGFDCVLHFWHFGTLLSREPARRAR